ncbi:MAG: cupredoxin domain-containing protein [Candidatus Eisenbacteria bacterium]
MTKRALIPALLLLAVAVVAAPALLARLRAPEAAPPRTVALHMREYTFNGTNPTLQFRPGERVHFIVTNEEESNVLHNFRVVGMNVDCGPPMKPGERREVMVTMPKSGEFAYTCCTHPGMGGKMVVAKK